MAFRENLLHLRAAHKLTQEQLAVRLGVSRQSVAKWESGTTYPEMDKLIALCQLFECTLDDLVTGDMTDQTPRTVFETAQAPVDLFGYDETMRSLGRKIPTGVAAICSGVSAGCLLFALGENSLYIPENIACALGFLLIILGVAAGLSFLVPAGLTYSAFCRAHPYLEDFYTEQDKQEARSEFTWQLLVGIIVLAMGIGAAIALDPYPAVEIFAPTIILGTVAVGVWFIIHGSMSLGRVNIQGYNEATAEEITPSELARADLTDEQRARVSALQRKSRITGSLCGAIMLLATAIALCLLFVPMAQADFKNVSDHVRPSYGLPWPIGGLISGIVGLLTSVLLDEHAPVPEAGSSQIRS